MKQPIKVCTYVDKCKFLNSNNLRTTILYKSTNKSRIDKIIVLMCKHFSKRSKPVNK